jgi:demethylmenaquinone methyltransferase/2-methoxy-6-polyprenyl-1,4-benzoquinol methylase
MSKQSKEQFRQKVQRINLPANKREKEKYVRGLFDSIADVYDLMNGLMSFGLHNYWRRYVVRRLGVFPGARVLDLCTGTADFTLPSAQVAGIDGMVVGFDFSTQMLAYAKNKLKDKGDGLPISLHQADALRLPYKDNSFDFATVGYGIRNLSDMDQGLREVCRVLKPGGKFGCQDLGRPLIPIYTQLYYLYFFHVVPQIGRLVAKNLEAYSYLPTSLHTFPEPKELQSRMQQAGFVNVHYVNLAGGAMALHIGQKPE